MGEEGEGVGQGNEVEHVSRQDSGRGRGGMRQRAGLGACRQAGQGVKHEREREKGESGGCGRCIIGWWLDTGTGLAGVRTTRVTRPWCCRPLAASPTLLVLPHLLACPASPAYCLPCLIHDCLCWISCLLVCLTCRPDCLFQAIFH